MKFPKIQNILLQGEQESEGGEQPWDSTFPTPSPTLQRPPIRRWYEKHQSDVVAFCFSLLWSWRHGVNSDADESHEELSLDFSPGDHVVFSNHVPVEVMHSLGVDTETTFEVWEVCRVCDSDPSTLIEWMEDGNGQSAVLVDYLEVIHTPTQRMISAPMEAFQLVARKTPCN